MHTQDLHPGPALPATPFQAAALTEEAARALFLKYAFAANGGEPICPHCASTAIYSYRSRPIYKCKQCERQFRATTGTPFEFRKLPWKKIIYLMVNFCHAPSGISARKLADDLNVNYRTVFTWLHRLRDLITDRMNAYDLRGSSEIEADVAYFGGYIRPKNVAKLRTDRRKVPYKNEKRRGVVSLVERGARVTTAITFSETHATDWIKANTLRAQPLFLDEAPGWSGLVQTRNVKQVNHDVAYATPTCNTNLAESLNAALRRAERGVHHHVSHNYLDFYAAETAWRQERPKRSSAGRVDDLLALGSRKRSSAMRGYYQGRRRRLPMVWSEHNVEPRARSKATVRNPKANAQIDAFTVMTASDVLATPELVPDQPGVYAIMLDGGARLLGDLGLPASPEGKVSWNELGCDHVYTGEAGGVRTRLLEHLSGDVGRSNFRQSLLALQWSASSSPASPSLATMDAELGRMLQDRAVIAFKACSLPGEVETHLLAHHASPLNVQRPDAGSNPAVRHLRTVRKQFRSEFRDQWPKHISRRLRR